MPQFSQVHVVGLPQECLIGKKDIQHIHMQVGLVLPYTVSASAGYSASSL